MYKTLSVYIVTAGEQNVLRANRRRRTAQYLSEMYAFWQHVLRKGGGGKHLNAVCFRKFTRRPPPSVVESNVFKTRDPGAGARFCETLGEMLTRTLVNGSHE